MTDGVVYTNLPTCRCCHLVLTLSSSSHVIYIRPYEIGDRIAVSDPESQTSTEGSVTWFVEDLGLYSTVRVSFISAIVSSTFVLTISRVHHRL